MKATWTCKRETIALIPPRTVKEKLEQILDLSERQHNGFVTITVETIRKPRTTGDKSQSHHLNGHIQQIATETGSPFEVVKLEVKHRAVGMGYPMALKEDGSVRLDIWGRVMGISESDSSTQECSLLIDACHMLASDLGIFLQEE